MTRAVDALRDACLKTFFPTQPRIQRAFDWECINQALRPRTNGPVLLPLQLAEYTRIIPQWKRHAFTVALGYSMARNITGRRLTAARARTVNVFIRASMCAMSKVRITSRP